MTNTKLLHHRSHDCRTPAHTSHGASDTSPPPPLSAQGQLGKYFYQLTDGRRNDGGTSRPCSCNSFDNADSGWIKIIQIFLSLCCVEDAQCRRKDILITNPFPSCNHNVVQRGKNVCGLRVIDVSHNSLKLKIEYLGLQIARGKQMFI